MAVNGAHTVLWCLDRCLRFVDWCLWCFGPVVVVFGPSEHNMFACGSGCCVRMAHKKPRYKTKAVVDTCPMATRTRAQHRIHSTPHMESWTEAQPQEASQTHHYVRVNIVSANPFQNHFHAYQAARMVWFVYVTEQGDIEYGVCVCDNAKHSPPM